jgi:hypothetical protein
LEPEILAPEQTGGKAIVARLDAEIDLRLAFRLRQYQGSVLTIDSAETLDLEGWLRWIAVGDMGEG